MIIRAANTLAEARRIGKLAGYAAVQPDWSIVEPPPPGLAPSVGVIGMIR
jgi:hypothetical protein